MIKDSYDVIIVGGGPAGLAAAVETQKSGVKDILIIEREHKLGGILRQCIHNGFGLKRFKESLTGPEYAGRFIDRVNELKIEYITETTVLSVGRDKSVTIINKTEGVKSLGSNDAGARAANMARITGETFLPYRPYRKKG